MTEKFNPFTELPETEDKEQIAYGIAKQFIHIMLKDAKRRGESVPTFYGNESFYDHELTNPMWVLRTEMEAVENLKTKNKELYDRTLELVKTLSDDFKPNGKSVIYGAKAARYLTETNQLKTLKEYRIKANLSQQEVAESVQITVRQYQRYESGESKLRTASYERMYNLALTLGTTVDSLMLVEEY